MLLPIVKFVQGHIHIPLVVNAKRTSQVFTAEVPWQEETALFPLSLSDTHVLKIVRVMRGYQSHSLPDTSLRDTYGKLSRQTYVFLC